MTHAAETAALNQLHFPAPVSATCVMHRPISIWDQIHLVYQIPAPIRKWFCSKPESGVTVTEMMTDDWSMIVAYVVMCFPVV